MSELKLPRLLQAAREFNIGQDTLIEFLVGKGFSRDALGPTSKLTEDMYRALQAGFQSDKVAKNKADQIEIPKGVQGERERKKKDEEVISFGKEVKPAPKEEPKPEAVKPEPVPEPVKEVKPEPAPVTEEVKPQAPPVVAEEPEILRIEAPELEGPKIIDKIDLSSIDSSTKPRKDIKKKEEKHEPVEQPVEKIEEPVHEEEEEEIVEEEELADIEEEEHEEEGEEERVIENIKAEKIEGPKILGKIDLPADSDTRPKPVGRDEKRKRKRIPIDKKPGDNRGGGQPGVQSRDNRGEGHGGFNRDRGNNAGGQGGFNRGGNQQQGGQQHGGGFNRDNRGGQQHGQNRPGGDNRPARKPITINKAGAGGNRPSHGAHREDKEIDQKEIQEKIRETQAKLAGSGGRGKSLKAKYRREKRHEMAEAVDGEAESNKLQVTEFVTVSELANLMDVSFADVISKCMSLGIMVSINQRLDAEVIELVAGEFGYEVEFMGLDDVEEEEEEEEDEEETLEPRAPIVTIMGHVDHGKTSLLDYIRSANVVAGEAGGITQHIGAYEVTLPNGKNITFLDTPGHEAFTAMRARGAKVTDIAVIVIAADDAVMPQTKEAISHAQAAGVPMIFAINKIDKDGANAKKIYEQLSQMNLLVEEWGGKYQSQELSAKKGLNVDLLLEKILLEAELLDVKANPHKEATGTIIEASLDKGRGYVATLLVQNGTLKQGDLLVSGQYFGRVKAMFNERNQREQEAPPSTPVVILGLNGAPQAGEKFRVYQDEAEAKDVATKRAQLVREQGLRAKKHITLDEIGRRLALGNFKELNVIIKGDVDGSVEALSDSLQKLSTEEIAVQVILKGVGQISESDVVLAAASDAIVVGFNVRPSSQANKLAEHEGVQIKMYSIIYNAIEEVKSAMEGLLEPKVEEKEVANVEIREVYKFDKATVAGCYVTDGKVKRDSKIRVFRDGILTYPRTEGGFAELGSLKRFKDDVKEVASGYECGLTIKNFADIAVGDTIVAYEETEVKRTL
ncbi:MAG TPA: translation initiation factor IF-2 [Chitinophagaceae bacterium]|nr:translation initiation factor IF-2 [Chitinophagaceae bacterium]